MRPNASECLQYRDKDGFCQLENRCWSGKECPKTKAQAEAAWNELLEMARKRASVAAAAGKRVMT
jgi:hypothetical protein